MLLRAVTAVAMLLSATVSASAQIWQGGGGFHGGGSFHVGGGFHGGGSYHHGGMMGGRPAIGMLGGQIRHIGVPQLGHSFVAGVNRDDMGHREWRDGHPPHWHYRSPNTVVVVLVAPYTYSYDNPYTASDSTSCVTYQPLYNQSGDYVGQQQTNQCDPETVSADQQ